MENEIQECIDNYKKWRESINFARKPIPDNFWKIFKDLQEKYPHHNIRLIFKVYKTSWDKKVLGLRSTSVSKKKKSKNKTYNKNTNEAPFVTLPNITSNNSINNLPPLMKFKLTNGIEITVFQ